MDIFQHINRVIAVIFFLCYAYQFCYLPLPWCKRRPCRREAVPHHFAVLICARNEAGVIADLLDSIHAQTYNPDLITTFVLADNCTDATAAVARQHGAAVYERHDRHHIGKGYALQALLRHLQQDYPAGFDGYFVFDADNILSPDYMVEMNRSFSQGHDIITSYRNSKNYGDNWISAGYALWFLRESRYLNHARFLLGTSCAVSGTGFLFSRKILQEMGDWPFHLLVEDIEFSIHHILAGHQIAFCPTAVLYDEQPTSFRQSWHQRSRWSRGYWQVFRRYGKRLLGGILRGQWACFDMTMAIMPAFLLTTVSLLSTAAIVAVQIAQGGSLLPAMRVISEMLGGMYLTLFVLGAITTVSEWRYIRTTTVKKLAYTLTFPLFMFTYLPIAVASLFCKAQWQPIRHQVCAAQLGKRCKEEALPF